MWKMNCWIRVNITGPWFTHSSITTMGNTKAGTLVTIMWLAVNTTAKTFPQKSKSWRFIDYHILKPDIAKRRGKKVERLYTED